MSHGDRKHNPLRSCDHSFRFIAITNFRCRVDFESPETGQVSPASASAIRPVLLWVWLPTNKLSAPPRSILRSLPARSEPAECRVHSGWRKVFQKRRYTDWGGCE